MGLSGILGHQVAVCKQCIDIPILAPLQEENMLRDNIVKSQKDPNKLVGMEWCVSCLTIHMQWITRLQVHHCE